MTDQETADAKKIIEQYVDGCRRGDLELLKSIFHPDAQMAGFLGGELLYGGPGPFFDAVSQNPPPANAGEPYSADISDVKVTGNVAQATLTESGFLGMNFVDYFHLLKNEGRWQIVSKTFMQL